MSEPLNANAWSHDHVFQRHDGTAEKGARIVMIITSVMMVVEIVAGWWFNSMALLADGWHMSSHALAIGLSAFAYAAARRYARDQRFAFGTWKIEILAGFASAILLLGVAALMVIGSIERIVAPQTIHYPEAMVIAAIGLVVNLVCAWVLGDAHHHERGGHADGAHAQGHAHAHAHDHDDGLRHDHEKRAAHSHHDLNLKSAYLHVLADAATSVFAIVALGGGWFYGWAWLDPVMGIAGAVLVAVWSRKLIAETGKVLLDREMDHPIVDGIRATLAEAPWAAQTAITDLHVWRVARRSYACAISLVTRDPSLDAASVRRSLATHDELAHATIEIHHDA